MKKLNTNSVFGKIIYFSHKAIQALSYFSERVLNTIKFNGIYLILSLAFPLVLWNAGVTRDFIVSLSQSEFSKNVSFISTGFFLLALSTWIIPAFSIYFFLLIKGQQKFAGYFYNRFLIFYNGIKSDRRNQFPARYLAILPWIVFTLILLYCYSIEKEGRNYLVLCLGLIIFIILIILVLDRIKEKIESLFNKRLLISLLIFLLLIPVFIQKVYSDTCQENLSLFFFCIIFYNLLLIFVTYIFLLKLEFEKVKNSKKYKFSYKLHLFILIFITSVLLLFCFMSYNGILGTVSPIVLLLAVSSFYILFFESFYTVPKTIKYIVETSKTFGIKSDFKGNYTIYRSLFYLIAIGFIFYLLYKIPEKEIYQVETNGAEIFSVKDRNVTDRRESIESYFEKWLNTNHIIPESDSVMTNVILISGEGGGSKAGSWLLANLLNTELNYPQLYSHIFSISTVSGSTTGANFYMAIKDKNLSSNNFSKKDEKVEYMKNIVTNIYTKNYFSSNFLGVLFSDYVFNPFYKENGSNQYRDRNQILRIEEEQALLSAFGNNSNIKNIKRSSYKDTLKINEDKIRDYYKQDYLSLWYNKGKMNDHEGNLLNPLFFINTTRVENGMKAYFSPVKANTGNIDRTRVIDVMREFYANRYKNQCDSLHIPTSAAVIQSEAFPLLNTYNFIPGVGHLGDGGMYENTGTETTLFIYKVLKNYVKKKGIEDKIRFILINYRSKPEKNKKGKSFLTPKNKLMIQYTVEQVMRNPFNGHAEDALLNLDKEVLLNNQDLSDDKKDVIFNLMSPDQLITTRLISKKTIKNIFNTFENPKVDATYTNDFNSLISLLNKQPNYPKTQSANGKLMQKYVVYIQYANPDKKDQVAKLAEAINNSDTGFYVPGIEYVPNFNINQIRYFYPTDSLKAVELSNIIKNAKIKTNNRLQRLDLKYFDYKNFKANVKTSQLEVWIN